MNNKDKEDQAMEPCPQCNNPICDCNNRKLTSFELIDALANIKQQLEELKNV